jgi:glycosyltransferase involved in cell wall biosynthesis
MLARREGDPPSFEVRGVTAGRRFRKYDLVARLRHELAYGKLVEREIVEFAPDVLISSNTPLDANERISRACRARGIRFVFWVQDLYGIGIRGILGAKFGSIGRAIGRHYIAKESRQLKRSDEVVLISEDFLPIVEGWGVPRARCSVVPNWAPLDEIPRGSKTNAWSRPRGLDAKRCILYAGTLGLKHDPRLLLKLAQRVGQYEDVRVVVLSEGPGAEFLASEAKRRGLANLLLFGYEPMEMLPSVLATADILVAILRAEAQIFSVPSKVLSYLCAGRPLLLAVPPANLAARVVGSSDAGIVVGSDAEESFLAGAELLLKDAALRRSLGANARRYAEQAFDIEAICSRFERLCGMEAIAGVERCVPRC